MIITSELGISPGIFNRFWTPQCSVTSEEALLTKSLAEIRSDDLEMASQCTASGKKEDGHNFFSLRIPHARCMRSFLERAKLIDSTCL
jgi:hypothetical protein